MSRFATAPGREHRAIAFRAATASIEASVTALEAAEWLIADGAGVSRRPSSPPSVRARATADLSARRAAGSRSLG